MRDRKDLPGDLGRSPGAASQGSADTDLVASYARGDRVAFRRIDGWIHAEIRSRYPALLHEVEDLCQIVHLKLLENLRQERFRGDSTFRSYVAGIVHYSAIDRLRLRYRDRDLLEAWGAHDRAASHRGPYGRIENDETRLLYRALRSLPEQCRRLWEMVLVERLSYQEIARRTGVPTGTVKSRMWHCRRKAMAALRRLRRASRR